MRISIVSAIPGWDWAIETDQGEMYSGNSETWPGMFETLRKLNTLPTLEHEPVMAGGFVADSGLPVVVDHKAYRIEDGNCTFESDKPFSLRDLSN